MTSYLLKLARDAATLVPVTWSQTTRWLRQPRSEATKTENTLFRRNRAQSVRQVVAATGKLESWDLTCLASWLAGEGRATNCTLAT
jgi:hypothetical protein